MVRGESFRYVVARMFRRVEFAAGEEVMRLHDTTRVASDTMEYVVLEALLTRVCGAIEHVVLKQLALVADASGYARVLLARLRPCALDAIVPEERVHEGARVRARHSAARSGAKAGVAHVRLPPRDAVVAGRSGGRRVHGAVHAIVCGRLG